jgi:hypothetical protein
MEGTLIHFVKGKFKPLLYWRHEGRAIITYWDSSRRKKQFAHLIGRAGTEHISGQDRYRYYNVGITPDLMLMGITESTINSLGFATAVDLRDLA